MTSRLARHPLVITAVALAVIGMLLAARAVQRAPAQVRQIRAKAERLERLQALAQEQQAPAATLAALEVAGSTAPAALASLLAETFPGETVDVEEGDPEPLRDGWALRTARLTLADVPLHPSGELVARMENSRPPWRVVEYTVIPGPVAGRGRVTLTAEALSR